MLHARGLYESVHALKCTLALFEHTCALTDTFTAGEIECVPDYVQGHPVICVGVTPVQQLATDGRSTIKCPNSVLMNVSGCSVKVHSQALIHCLCVSRAIKPVGIFSGNNKGQCPE